MRIDATTADRMTAIVLFALGSAMLIGGYQMDRLEIRQIHPASIPGLVPMGLGAAMALCAVLLYFSAVKSGEADSETESPGSYKDLIVTTGMCLVYGAGLVGKAPFFLATAIFLFSFSSYFLWPSADDKSSESMPARIKFLAFNAAFALIFAGAISALFRYGFLVRLP